MKSNINIMKNEKTGKLLRREFQIFKPLVTDYPIWILSKQGEPFNQMSKIHKYVSLGYEVTSVQKH